MLWRPLSNREVSEKDLARVQKRRAWPTWVIQSAQVFAQNPKLLILDEPANHLDLIYQKHIFSLIEAWLKQPGRAVISVVHDLSLAKKYGTHAVLMDRGRCAAQGKTAEVMTRERLEAVYGMDVYGWMRDLLGQWA